MRAVVRRPALLVRTRVLTPFSHFFSLLRRPSRTRKIRCDGARPVCLHCSRRAATGTDDGVLCSYDAAPKRRGPDKNPGSRQRVPAPESSDGGKVRRRRRRDTGADRASIPMAAAGPSSPLAGELREPVPKVPQHALAPYLAHAPAAAGAAREMRIQDVYRAPQQPLPAGEPLGAHGASLRGITHPSNSLERVATVSEPQYSHTQARPPLSHDDGADLGAARLISSHAQLSTQISPTQQYHQLSAAEGLPYPRYLPLPSSSGSQANREYEYDDEVDQQSSDIGAEPSLRTTRDTWWDALIALYTTHMQPQGAVLTPGVRESMAQQITSDLRFLFRASNYWFSFFNVPRFFANLMDPAKRAALQPSLILAALAAANFIRSSEQESGQAGRAWSLTLLEQAQAMLESSINARWIDESLVQASWVRPRPRTPLTLPVSLTRTPQLIAFFEISAHPLHNGIRVRSALSMLDSLVRSLAMAALDRTDARASRFAARAVPTVSPAAVEYGGGGAAGPTWDVAPHTGAHAHAHHHTGAPPQRTPPAAGECACGAYTLGRNWSHAQELTPLWLMTPAWSEDATDAEIRKEECRRLVWSSVTMVAGYTSFTAANNVMPAVDLSLMDPANVRAPSFYGCPRALTACGSTRCCSPARASWRRRRARRRPCGRCTCARCCCGTRACARAGTRTARTRRRRSSRSRRGSRRTGSRRRSTRIRAASSARSCSRGASTCSSACFCPAGWVLVLTGAVARGCASRLSSSGTFRP